MIKNVTVFCGYQPKGDKGAVYLAMAKDFGALLAKEGFGVVSGGNGGMMTETCRGAHEAGGVVHCISLRREQWPLDDAAFTHDEDFVELTPRQQRLLQLGDAYVALPGGIGTHFEILEVLCKKGVDEIPRDRPFICVGDEFIPLKQLIASIVENGMSYSDPLSLITFVSTIDEAMALLRMHR